MIERLVTVSLDTARAMLEQYEIIIPFGIRASSESDDLKMNCPGDKDPSADWDRQIDWVVDELKDALKNEAVAATALVSTLVSGDETAVGLQVETAIGGALFIYPYQRDGDEWRMEEPIQSDHLLRSVFSSDEC